ncbi:MAG: serine/threonine-protein kinase [Pseudomonadota bacterium]
MAVPCAYNALMGVRGPCPGMLLDGAYALKHAVGRGAAGQVWLADDVVLNRPVAVKIVPPELVGSNTEAWRVALRREAAAMASIRHSNVAGVFAFGRHRDLHYYIMEWVDGETLAAEIEQQNTTRRRMTLRRGLRIVAEACRGLAAVHEAGIVHRDVKPSNIMLARDGRVVLIDFGLVRMPDGAGPGGAPVGTPRYMAPELARSTSLPPSEEMYLADIYSLGATAYELVTGAPPFPGEGAREVISRHLHELPDPPSRRRRDLPAVVDRLILRALAKRPRERYLSCEDMRAAVAAVAARLRPEPVAAAPRVLVVDDDADFRAFVCSFVRRLAPDAYLYTAGDGAEALDMARRIQPHLVVLDFNVPSMNGLELVKVLALCPETTRTRVVVVSGAAGGAERARFEKLGVVRVLEKPLTPVLFIEAIRTALAVAA